MKKKLLYATHWKNSTKSRLIKCTKDKKEDYLENEQFAQEFVAKKMQRKIFNLI